MGDEKTSGWRTRTADTQRHTSKETKLPEVKKNSETSANEEQPSCRVSVRAAGVQRGRWRTGGALMLMLCEVEVISKPAPLTSALM